MDGLILSIISIPRIIYIAKKRKLFDVPDNKRKLHLTITPNIGGMGIFFGYIITISLFISPDKIVQMGGFTQLHFIIASSFILFLTGLYDDLANVNPNTKFIAQLMAAVITIYFADIRLTSLHGLLGIYELPRWISIIFSIIGCVFITNAVNLIDGIDGLAGSFTVLSTSCLGICLALSGNIGAACIATGLLGTTIGFLRFNISPARIFMGDTGSLFIGFNISILAILTVNSFNQGSLLSPIVHSEMAMLNVALAILFVPVFDSFRVFLNRALKGQSPFKADRTHLHHLLLDAGFTHSEAVVILMLSNLLIVITALFTQDENINITFASIIGMAFILFTSLYYTRKKRLDKNSLLLK
jgi:UDP-N-acetylmuramyl pentapeptide phosphotransferase/UDP-N-acetylglucosamine-1-phosphate transferase